jgi:hypothetical protein
MGDYMEVNQIKILREQMLLLKLDVMFW